MNNFGVLFENFDLLWVWLTAYVATLIYLIFPRKPKKELIVAGGIIGCLTMFVLVVNVVAALFSLISIGYKIWKWTKGR